MATEISTLKPLVEGTELTTSTVSVYTVPASTKGTIKMISLFNDDSSNHTVSIWIVPSGGSVALATKRYKEIVYAGKTFDIECLHVLNAAATLRITCDSNSVCSVAVHGFEITNVS